MEEEYLFQRSHAAAQAERDRLDETRDKLNETINRLEKHIESTAWAIDKLYKLLMILVFALFISSLF